MPADNRTDLEELHPARMLVGSAWMSSASDRVEHVYNPATGATIGRVPFCTPAEVQQAVEAAHGAFPAWRATPPLERARLMFRYRDLLERHFEELARLVTRENGKTLAESRGEVRRGIEVVEFASGAPTLLLGEWAEDVASGMDSTLIRAPLGAVAGICPFNFPAMIPLWMFPIALVCGNTFVLKPSERTPLTGVRLTELLVDAGLPPGVLNVVHGAQGTVDALLSASEIKAISFVGSEPVARYVYTEAARHGKRVQALAGAKNHIVVMPDANIAETAEAILSAAFGNAGERCMAASVVVAVDGIADALVARLRDDASRIVVGNGAEAGTQMGPVIRREHKDRIVQYIERGLTEGARLVLDGRSPRPAQGSPAGFFVGPCIFDGIRPEMIIAREEIFGPVLSVMRVPDLETAIQTANRSRFGNGASIFTRSGAAAREFTRGVEAGMVGVNVGVPTPMAWLPFAGWKGSFFGDLHATGTDGVRFYTEVKVVTSRWRIER